jgi:hypothetical protein
MIDLLWSIRFWLIRFLAGRALIFAVGSHEGKVVIEFGTPVAWLGMTPDQALQLAKTLESRARYVKFGAKAMLGSPKKVGPKGQRR